MMKEISITVPMDYLALTRASEMFHALAQDVNVAIDGAVETVPAAEPTVTPIQGNAAPVVTPAAKKEIPRTDKPDPKSLDADGIPWDGRIHGKSQTRLARGNTWTLIRGIEAKSPGLVDQVKAELLAAQTATTEQPATVTPITPASQAFGNQQPATVDPVVTTVAPIDFAGLAAKITPRVVATPEYNQTIQAVLIEFGVSGGLPMLMGMPDLIPQIDAKLDSLWQG